MDAFKRGSIHMQPNVDLSNTQGPFTPAKVKRIKGVLYASVVGSIMYADLRNTKDLFLVYGGDSTTEFSVTCYTDASWETDWDDLRSQIGYVFVMNGGAIDWKSSKQSTTTMSSKEAKYIAASKAAMEAILIHKFISRLGVVPSIDKPMDMYYNNTCAITITDEPGVQKANNLADSFTKPMYCTKHVEHARNIGLRPAVGAVGCLDLVYAANSLVNSEMMVFHYQREIAENIQQATDLRNAVVRANVTKLKRLQTTDLRKSMILMIMVTETQNKIVDKIEFAARQMKMSGGRFMKAWRFNFCR
ncbi:hypothetical protein Tco_0363166 [Tanacetum coccineum]